MLQDDDYFMALAVLASKRSPDPNTKVGACILDKNKNVSALGFNRFPRGCQNFPWSREGEMLETKYAYILHAETDALTKKTLNVEGGELYVTLFPCNECAKLVIESGITKVTYLSNKYEDTDAVKASRKLLEAAGIKYIKFEPKGNDKVELNLKD